MRNITTLFLLLCLNAIALSQNVSLKIQDNGVLFKDGNENVLFYQTANKELNGAYKRTNYIHPLYGLDGTILTEDFPEDHLHHRGIFWAWHQLYVGEKRIGDGWEIKDFKWEVQSVKQVKKSEDGKSITANVIWKSPLWLDDNGKEKPLVSENTTITVYPASKNYRQIDIEISLLAKEPNMRIGGSEDEKGYGGFSPRIRLVEDIAFSGSNGSVTPHKLPVEADGWLDISGSLGDNGAKSGVTIFSHPNNPGYPNPWILRSKGSMQNAVYPHPGDAGVGLSENESTVLRYSLLIHTGLKKSEISTLHSQYGER